MFLGPIPGLAAAFSMLRMPSMRLRCQDRFAGEDCQIAIQVLKRMHAEAGRQLGNLRIDELKRLLSEIQAHVDKFDGLKDKALALRDLITAGQQEEESAVVAFHETKARLQAKLSSAQAEETEAMKGNTWHAPKNKAGFFFCSKTHAECCAWPLVSLFFSPFTPCAYP